ncbi:MAG TPA: beta-phosphoglucomutase [Anaerolineales bacterium]|nr:beta-phosphoglucomutase [Anaerolineales bacterium]
MTKIRAIIFDLDGVLTNTSEYHYRAWKQLADELGVPFDRQRNESLRGVSRRRSLELLLDGRTATEEQMQEWMAHKNTAYQALIRQLSPRDLLPGALELLRECRKAGLKVAVASASRNARTVVERLGIEPLLDRLVDGHTVPRQKPAADLFLKAAELLGVPPEACVVVEDAASGIAAARAAGMRTVGLGPPERVGAADLVAPDLSTLTLNAILRIQPAPSNWHITETAFDPAALHHRETLFTIGNGYLGTRGSFEEGYPGDRPATLVHGVFDDHPLVYTEMVNLPNWLPFVLLVNGERFRMDRGTVLSYRRHLHLPTGVLTRTVRWRSPAGHTVDLEIERFASLADPHLLGIRYRVTALDFNGQLEFRASLDGHALNPELFHWRQVAQGTIDQQGVYLHTRTQRSSIEVCEACRLDLSGGRDVIYTYLDCEGNPGVAARLAVRPEETVQADKLVALFTSREVDDVHQAALSALEEAVARGYDAAPRHDDRASIPAKALSGFGYRGHVFWDTDIFILPYPHGTGIGARLHLGSDDPAVLHPQHRRDGAEGGMSSLNTEHIEDTESTETRSASVLSVSSAPSVFSAP